MTAPNTPTPELERYDLVDGNQGYEPAYMYPDATGEWCRHDQAAAAIAKLTAERDKWRDAWMKSAHDEAEAIRERDEAIERAEAAEGRIKELEAKLKRITAIGEDNLEKLKSYIDATPAIEASNKLLTERVAVLETGLQRLASPEAFTVPRMANEEEQARMHYADDVLRRALAAREAK